eukprot:2223645-Karenia_brevis.AAC.1
MPCAAKTNQGIAVFTKTEMGMTEIALGDTDTWSEKLMIGSEKVFDTPTSSQSLYPRRVPTVVAAIHLTTSPSCQCLEPDPCQHQPWAREQSTQPRA